MLSLKLVVDDIYDFAYTSADSFASKAAIVQAGYPSLGNAGHVGAVRINVDNTVGIGSYLGPV